MSEDGDTPGFVLVSCGTIQAKLWMDKFICPGIHQKCIEIDGEMMTPKAFCIMGEKVKLKDWKNAIRINGRSIRKHMDSGDLDFHKHNEICTGRCMSRSYGNSKYDVKIENLSQNTDSAEWPSLVPYEAAFDGAAYNGLHEIQSDSSLQKPWTNSVGHVVFPGMEEIDSPPGGVVIKQEQCSDDEQKPVQDIYQNDIPIAKSSSQSLSSGTSTVPGTKHRRKNAIPQQVPSNGSRNTKVVMNGAISVNETKIVKLVSEFPDTESLMEDSVAFWQNVLEMDLLDDIIRDAKHCLDSVKNDMTRHGIQETDARKLSDVINDLGLVTKVKWRMAEHKMRTEDEKEQLLREIEALKKKVLESEEKRQVLKRKSDCFDSLIELARPKRAATATPTSTASVLSDNDTMATEDLEEKQPISKQRSNSLGKRDATATPNSTSIPSDNDTIATENSNDSSGHDVDNVH